MISRRILVISRSPALSRAIHASLGPGYEVVTSTSVSDVVDEVLERGPFDVLVAGPAFDSHAGMARLATLRATAPVPTVVLALGPKPKANLSDIVRTGAVELVEYPTSKRQLAAALKRAFDIADASQSAEAPTLPVVAHGVVVERPTFAEVFTVASSSGGCGKTFYATNLACYLAAQTGQRVCLVDLDLQFGEVSTALHLRPRFTISDLLSREPVDDDDLDEHVEQYLEEHELGFSVLAAPFSPADADMIAPKDVYKVMGALRRHFDYIVVDTPAQLSEIVLAAFDHSTRVLCMVTLDLPSIRNMRVFLSTLEKLRINSEAIGVVLNKVEEDIGIDISDVQEVLDNKIVSVLPYSREVMKSINRGKPALVSAANSDIGKKLAGGMHQFLSGEATPVLGTAANTAAISESRRLLAEEERSHQQGARAREGLIAMNLSEKLAAADDAAPAPPPEATPPWNRRAGDPGGPPERPTASPVGPPGSKAHPMRRAADRTAMDEAWKQSKAKVQAKVLAEIAPTAADLSPDELRERVRSTVNEILEREDIGISPIERQRFVEEMLEDSLGYGPLEGLLADGSVTEIMCNSYDEIWIERKGLVERSDIVFTSSHQYRRIIDRMVHGVGRRVDESSPMVDARLADGSRINAIVPPLALRGPVLTIRKFPERALVMQDLIALGTLTMDSALFLEALVRGKISMVVVGGTGTGKTTMLNVLSNFIPDGERLITIEESAELQIQGAHVVTLETRPANAEGTGEVRIRDLVRNSLRMRPDRIIVGECRGSETLDMLQAMNTGHAGSMTTVHANTPRELLGRLETMVMMGGVELPQRAIREQIVMAVGILVQLQRTAEGPRVVTSITEIQGMEGDTVLLQDIFHRVDTSEGMGRLVPTGLRPKILDELALSGVEVPPKIFRNDEDPLLASSGRSGAGRHHRPARPGRVVEPPTEEMYEILARRRDGGR